MQHTPPYTKLVRELTQDVARVQAMLHTMDLRLAGVASLPSREQADVAAWRDQVDALRSLLVGMAATLAAVALAHNR